jgi:eukaryotic-like serine/threonine-protein kinase
MRLEAGQRIGDRYRLIQRIGSGGMADVWSADDSMLQRTVALKFLHDRFAQDSQFVERFRREAQAAAGLQHPNVVGVYDRGEWEGRHWIAMEYVEGASLKDLITRGLSTAEAVEIVRQILAGAKFAHERNIIHRDLKPHNVLVDPEGRARVTDFGIARAGASEITQTGSVLGTAQYLSPEQAQGFEVGAQSDLYSVGVILYEALTGRVPFEGESAVAIALKQVSEQPRPPSEVNPQVPPALNAVVLRALAKDPAARYQSADEFLAALDAAEADPTTPIGDTAAYAAAAVVPVEDPVEEERRRKRRRRLIILAVIALLIAAVVAYALTRKGQELVPAVIGESQEEAERILGDAGFEAFPRTVENCDEANTVTEQDPPAGEQADESSTVVITVSLGLKVRVPDVGGKPVREATEQIRDEQLQADERQAFSANVAPGRVIRTEPAAGQSVECQSTVTMVVSKGENTAEVPSVLGLSQEDASAQLRQAGFLPNVETRNADEPEGQVIGQDPGPGSVIAKGSEVQITVSNGQGTVVVPDVEGQPRDTAVSLLQGRGVTNIKIVEQETTDEGDDDRVTEQAPSGGTRIRAGERVTIFVAVFVEPEPEPTTTTSTTTDETGPPPRAGAGR